MPALFYVFADAVVLSAHNALRNAFGKHTLAVLLSERDRLGHEIQTTLDEKTSAWGITTQAVEIRDVIMPQGLEDAMSRQAQAERERQSRIILGTAETEIADSFNIDPHAIADKITPRTKAIIAVHLQGTTADLDPIMELADRHKLLVLEDCAQCLGGEYHGKYVGSIGNIGINSCQQSKSITAGEGGAVVTNDNMLFERAVRFHDVGALRSPYREEFSGGLLAAFAAPNFRTSEFTGAVLKGQRETSVCQRSAARRPHVERGL